MSRNFELVCGDAIVELRKLDDRFANLIIADPPYNLGPQFGVAKEWDRSPEWASWCREWLKECARVLDDDGQIFVYGIHHFVGYMQVALYDLGFQYRRQIIWHYENGWSRSRKTLATHYEPILWFSKSEKYTYHEIREPYKSTDRLKYPVKKGDLVWRPNPDGRLAGDVWSFPTLAGRRFRDERVAHPTQKPLSLTDRIVRHFSSPGDLVASPFAGSGTEGVSAVSNGRRYWGCEIKPEYVDLALDRISSAART